jgi:hypothetical protein
MIWFAFFLSLVMGIGSLAWTYAQIGQVPLALFLLLFGFAWLYACWKNWNWFSTAGIFLTLGLAAYGLWIDLSAGWMFAGALGGLMAWDLADFICRIHAIPESDAVQGLRKRHLARLTIVAIVGLTLASIAMLVRLEFSFEWLALLTLMAILGISQMIGWLRKGGD